MRINKYIATCGICSRRKADELIESGKVTLNGEVIYDFPDVNPDYDVVEVCGKVINVEETKYYIALHKPKGFITSVSDDRDRRCVTELVSDINARLFPVGRLDFNTSGLLILTNDGEFANSVMHPRKEVYKTYLAHISGKLHSFSLETLKKGVIIEEGVKTAPAKVQVIKEYPASCDVEISIREGKNRQVRRMFEALGHEVLELKRVSVGCVNIGNIPLGKWRHLTKQEIRFFK